MKRTLLYVLLLSLLCIASADAAQLTSTTDTKYVSGTVKTISVAMPSNCSAMNGTLALTNCTLYELTENFPTKQVETNANKFVLYGLNQDIMSGENLFVRVLIDNDETASVSIVDCAVANPDALPIEIADFEIVLSSVFDLDNDGDEDADDIVIAIEQVFNGNMTIVDVQKIINAVLQEI